MVSMGYSRFMTFVAHKRQYAYNFGKVIRPFSSYPAISLVAKTTLSLFLTTVFTAPKFPLPIHSKVEYSRPSGIGGHAGVGVGKYTLKFLRVTNVDNCAGAGPY